MDNKRASLQAVITGGVEKDGVTARGPWTEFEIHVLEENLRWFLQRRGYRFTTRTFIELRATK